MSKSIELACDGCTAVFRVQGVKAAHAVFDVEIGFSPLSATFPPLPRCSLSQADVERLINYVDASLDESEGCNDAFAAYDAFFTLQFLGGDSVRLMLNYRPSHPFSLGFESTISEQTVAAFRDGWLAQLADMRME